MYQNTFIGQGRLLGPASNVLFLNNLILGGGKQTINKLAVRQRAMENSRLEHLRIDHLTTDLVGGSVHGDTAHAPFRANFV